MTFPERVRGARLQERGHLGNTLAHAQHVLGACDIGTWIGREVHPLQRLEVFGSPSLNRAVTQFAFIADVAQWGRYEYTFEIGDITFARAMASGVHASDVIEASLLRAVNAVSQVVVTVKWALWLGWDHAGVRLDDLVERGVQRFWPFMDRGVGAPLPKAADWRRWLDGAAVLTRADHDRREPELDCYSWVSVERARVVLSRPGLLRDDAGLVPNEAERTMGNVFVQFNGPEVDVEAFERAIRGQGVDDDSVRFG